MAEPQKQIRRLADRYGASWYIYPAQMVGMWWNPGSKAGLATGQAGRLVCISDGHVAELVYAYASGAYERKLLRVRVSPCPQSMKIEIKQFKGNALNVLRQAGYVFQHGESKGEMSFIRPMTKAGYPRFHIYATLTDASLNIKIHLDQKKETYGQSSRHQGEYENEGALKTEIDRLQQFFG